MTSFRLPVSTISRMRGVAGRLLARTLTLSMGVGFVLGAHNPFLSLAEAVEPALEKGTVGILSDDKGTIGLERGGPGRRVLPRRLVIALDGVSFRDVERMQWNGEIFSDFHPVSRNVSTFPSISDVSWADIFHTEAPDGYQRFHYSVGRNQIVGGSMSDLGNPIEYERRMHLAFDELGHHIHSYLFAPDAAQLEIREIERRFFESQGNSESFYVYMLSTDTLQHTGGDIRVLLKSLDAGLVRMQKRYLQETGGRLEVVLVSDHGHNHVGNGKRVPLEELFLEHGFRKTSRIEKPGDVVYTTAGILTSLAIFAADSDLNRLQDILVGTEGVDLVSRVGRADDLLLMSAQGKGRAVIRKVSPDRYSYEPEGSGDPLGYAGVVAELRRNGVWDESTQSALADDWLKATVTHLYPAAPERLYRGHRFVTKNPSQLLVSLLPGYENADSTVKWMTHFKRRGGTHGSLRSNDSVGILLSNFVETHDTTTRNVMEQFRFNSLRAYEDAGRGARFYSGEATGWDYLSRSAVSDSQPLVDERSLFLNIWDANEPVFEEMGLKTHYRARLKPEPSNVFERIQSPFLPSLLDRSFEASQLPKTMARTEYRLAWGLLTPEAPLEPGLYRLEIAAERFSSSGRREVRQQVAVLRFVVTTDGRTLPY